MINYSVSWSSQSAPAATNPSDPLADGLAAHLQGDLERAIADYARALRERPQRILAAYNLGVALIDAGCGLSSIPLFARAVRQWPGSAVLRGAWIYALVRAGRHSEAEQRLAEAESLGLPPETLARWRAWIDAPTPDAYESEAHPTPARIDTEPPDVSLDLPTSSVVQARLQEDFAHLLRLYQSDQIEALFTALARALVEQPSWGEVHHLHGLAAMAKRDFEMARRSLVRATELIPGRAEIWDHLGVACVRCGDAEAARMAFEQSLCLNPVRAETWNNAADAALRCYQLESAFQYALQALRLDPELLIAGYSLLQAAYKLLECGRPDTEPADDQTGPLAFAAKTLKAKATDPERALVLAGWLSDLGRFEDAIEILAHAQESSEPQPPQLLAELIRNQLYGCNWHRFAERCATLIERIRTSNQAIIRPFAALAIPGLTPFDQQRIARLHAANYAPWSARAGDLPPAPAKPAGARLRIGYLSDDFQEHATAYLTAALFERHDRTRFEVFAYSTGQDDGGPMRRRLRAAIEHFVDIRDLSHEEAARRIRADGIDILVDLKGYTRNARLEILAQRPSPIQVSWLGFPGGLGSDFIDYLIADPIVIPPESVAAYDEAIAYLPDAYAPVDDRRQVGARPTRTQVGLPEDAFVFACFNDPYKITPVIFDRWCQLLKAVPRSVLWLYARTEAIRRNLRREAEQRGLDAGRLIFAPNCPQPEHLARLPLADLMLDTLPVNAHTTASDALWMGVPLVTCQGETFAARVASSLLTACGLSELITTDLDRYQALALDLATHPARLQELRTRLSEARAHAPFFDGERFARQLEELYCRLWERHLQGVRPDRLDVPACSGAQE
ncbi:MAG: O-linked N-acetylglucosamine transferase family protein [Thermochromatium sp.]